MNLRISHTGAAELIIQSNAKGTLRIQPLSLWQRLTRQHVALPIGDNELIVIRSADAKEPDGTPFRAPI